MVGGGASGFAGRCMRSALRSSVATKTPTTARAWQRAISFSAVLMHGADDHDHDHDFVPIGKKHGVPVTHASAAYAVPHAHNHAHDHDHEHGHEHDHNHDSDDDDSDDEDMVDTVAVGPSGIEYGGPQRGGQFKEPTRFGDWERKGRCTDF